MSICREGIPLVSAKWVECQIFIINTLFTLFSIFNAKILLSLPKQREA